MRGSKETYTLSLRPRSFKNVQYELRRRVSSSKLIPSGLDGELFSISSLVKYQRSPGDILYVKPKRVMINVKHESGNGNRGSTLKIDSKVMDNSRCDLFLKGHQEDCKFPRTRKEKESYILVLSQTKPMTATTKKTKKMETQPRNRSDHAEKK